MLVIREVFLRAAKCLEVNGVEERLKRGIVTREQCQEFRHTTGLCKGKTQEPIMGEIALTILHGIDDDIKLVGDIANNGIRCFNRIRSFRCHTEIAVRNRRIIFNLRIFGHKDILSADGRLRILRLYIGASF